MKKLIALSLALVLALSLCACGGVDAKYTALIECLDAHDYEGAMAQVYMLRQQAIDNGDIVIVEPQEEDYNLVNRYRSIGNNLMNYDVNSYFSAYDYENEVSLSENKALAYCYAQLQQLEGVDKWLESEYFEFEEGFPTDRAALLARFAIVPDKLVTVTREAEDNMGNVDTYDHMNYFYDENGNQTIVYHNGSASYPAWEGLYNSYGYCRYVYNDAGQITEYKITDREGDDVNAVVTVSYDDAGKMVSEVIRDNNGEYMFNYTYDAAGKLVQMDFVGDYNDYSCFYTYDDAGNLIQKDRHTYSYQTLNDEKVRYTTRLKTTVNTYDETGNLSAAQVTDQNFSRWYENGSYVDKVYSEKVDTVSYSYDAQGRLLQEIWNYGDTVYTSDSNNNDAPQYRQETLNYIYEDFYIFN